MRVNSLIKVIISSVGAAGGNFGSVADPDPCFAYWVGSESGLNTRIRIKSHTCKYAPSKIVFIA